MNAHCFVDGGYLRAISKKEEKPLVDPRTLANNIAYSKLVQFWRTPRSKETSKEFVGAMRVKVGLSRVIYYDAKPEEDRDPAITEYWKAVELLPDTETKFGRIRGRPLRQKGVDALIAVDMLTGAFNSLFEVGILVAGDADFVPIVERVQSMGAMVLVAAEERSLADELRRAADRVWIIDPQMQSDLPSLAGEDERRWREDSEGNVTRD